jgi:enterochelin esterase-like enzyme
MDRMKRVALAAALLFGTSIAHAQSAGDISIGSTRVIKSRVLGEDRKLFVYLPESYAQSSGYRRYPVLYVRDGGKFFHSFTGAVQHLSADATPHVPEMIVVGISESDRVRDSASTRSLQGFTGKTDPGFRQQRRRREFPALPRTGAGALHRPAVQHVVLSDLLRLLVHRAERDR